MYFTWSLSCEVPFDVLQEVFPHRTKMNVYIFKDFLTFIFVGTLVEFAIDAFIVLRLETSVLHAVFNFAVKFALLTEVETFNRVKLLADCMLQVCKRDDSVLVVI